MEKRRIRRKQGNTHISLAAIRQYLLNGSYPTGSTPSDKRSVRKRAESFKIEDGELYYIVRPKRIEGEPLDPNPGANKANLRKAIIMPRTQLSIASLVHAQGGAGTHMGTERTLCALTSKYYWVGMANTVRKVVKNCVICLANRPAVATLPQSSQPIATANVVNEHEAAVPSPHDTSVDQKGENFGDSQLSTKTDETTADMQYFVTAELANPDEVDSEIDFDPNSAIVNSVFNPRAELDMAKKFWQKVEVQIFGPFTYKRKKSVYVIAAMDNFSKWPEIHTSYSLTEKTVSQFCLRLIARYGIMEQLIFLENENMVNSGLDPGGIYHNLQVYNVFVSKENVNIVDESWNRLISTIERFVNLYSEHWMECLEFCLIPLRNSLTRATDFTPAYLLMGREPIFPETVIPGKDSVDVEVALSQDQIEQAIDTAMGHYLHCTIPDIKRVILPSETPVPVYESTALHSVRKSGRKKKKYHRLAGFDDDISVDNDEDFEDTEVSSSHLITENDVTPVRQRNVYKKSAESKVVTKQELGEKDTDLSQDSQTSTAGDKYDNMLDKIDLDTYYKVVYLYKSESAYPPNSDENFKRIVRRVSEHFVIEKGRLMYRQRGKLKQVPMTQEERLKLMNELHINKEEHISRVKMTEAIESKGIIWRGMVLDVQAFVMACPGCKLGEPRKRRRTSKKALRWFKGVEDEEEDSDLENSKMGQVSCDDIVNYVKRKIIPDNLSRSELLIFRKKSRNFKVDKGVLYYCPSKDHLPRKVLRLDNEKEEALKTAHGDSHLGLAAMKSELRKSYFWLGMVDDIERFLSTCCQPGLCSVDPDTDGEKRNPALDEKIKLFQDFFAGKEIRSTSSSLKTLFPRKEPVTATIKDLVAAAMESAELTATIASPGEAKLVSDSSQLPDIPLATDISSSTTETISANSNTEMVEAPPETVNAVFPAAASNFPAVEVVAPKLEIADPVIDGKSIMVKTDQSGMDTENGEVMDVLEEEDDDRDEDWQPPTHSSVITGFSTQDSAEAKKRCIRKRCEVCQEVIRGDNNFKEHMYKHTKVKPFHCNICHKKFTSVKGLKMHYRKHTGHRPYLCNICGRGFPRSASLRYHIRTHDKGGGSPVVCDVCQRTFTTENRMQKHKRYKHPAQAPVHMCEQCGKIFTAKRSLKRHEEAHRGIRKYVCQYCKRSFFRKEYLNYHLASHSNLDPTLANYKVKSKIRSISRKKGFGGTRHSSGNPGVSIVCIDSSGVEMGQDQEVYGHLVEVTDPQEWAEQETAMVYEIDSGQRGEENSNQAITGDGATVVVMKEQPGGEGGMEVQHIIMPSDQLSHNHKQDQHIAIHRLQQQQLQQQPGRAQSFEVTLPTGTHTFTLPSGNQLHATESGQETVQYQVECLSGETLTEDDFNAIRMLAQASLSGTHLVQQ